MDIYFDYCLVLKVIEGGVDKICINFGNIGCCEKVEVVVNVVKVKNILICIGVNVGLFEKCILDKYGYLIVDGMVESVFYYIKILEDFDFYDIIVLMKVLDVNLVIEVYEKVV